MTEISRRSVLLMLPFLSGLVHSQALAQSGGPFASSVVPPPKPALLQLLRRGGNTIYFRHAETDNFSDRANAKLDDCATQRNLNEGGRQQSLAIGEAFRKLAIPVGEVLSSPYCRCLDTARLAFGRVEQAQFLYSLGQPKHPEDMARAELLRQRFLAPPAPPANTILVSHGSPLDSVAGEFLREGEAAVVRPAADGKLEVVARIQAEEWLTWFAAP